MKKFAFLGEDCYLKRTGFYWDGSPVVDVFSVNGERMARLSVCIDGAELAHNEILVKTWSENEQVAKAVLEAGLARDTGVRYPTGFVEAQVWVIDD